MDLIEKMNNTKNTKLIRFDNSYNTLYFSKVYDDVNFLNIPPHPVSDYYLNPCSTSLNLTISFKWLIWAYVFFKEISNLFMSLQTIDSRYIYKKYFINSLNRSYLIHASGKNHELLISNRLVTSDADFIELVENDKEFYSTKLIGENSKIHVELKINLQEYLFLTNDLIFFLSKLNKNW